MTLYPDKLNQQFEWTGEAWVPRTLHVVEESGRVLFEGEFYSAKAPYRWCYCAVHAIRV